MLKKMRRRFVIVSMSLITVVLALAFFFLLFFNNQRLTGDVEQALERELNGPGEPYGQALEIGMPGRREPGLDVTSFVVLVDDEEEIQEIINPRGISISEDTLEDLVEDVLESGRSRGVLSDYSLRYALRQDDWGTRIAFADISGSRENSRSLILLSLAVGVGGWLALLGITIFLSHQIVRPVERAWAQQRRFIADASHELKTPLTVILANLDVLQAHQSEPLRDNARWLDSSRDEAERMRGLVEDMLFLARADAGQDKTVLTDVSLSDAVTNCLLSFEPVAFESGVTLEDEVEPGLRVQGDAAQLRRLAAILMDNAIKYAGEQGRVLVKLEKRDERPVLRVENTGEKIRPEDASHIFDRFYRTDPSRNSEHGGYGLGLAIAHEIAQHHGARLELLPDEGEMTVFQVTF